MMIFGSKSLNCLLSRKSNSFIKHLLSQASRSEAIPLSKCRSISYVQGQSSEPKIREYFYFIDHQGMLFLDDSKMKNFTSCFKDKDFLVFFFKRLKINNTGRYNEDFPYISLCGRERNFVRCDDCPVVFTHVVKRDTDILSYGHAGDLLTVKFEPEKVIMIPQTGRVYHPSRREVGGIGLVRSNLAIEFSKYFVFDNGEHEPPTHFTWNNTTYKIMPQWYNELDSNLHHKIIPNHTHPIHSTE